MQYKSEFLIDTEPKLPRKINAQRIKRIHLSKPIAVTTLRSPE